MNQSCRYLSTNPLVKASLTKMPACLPIGVLYKQSFLFLFSDFGQVLPVPPMKNDQLPMYLPVCISVSVPLLRSPVRDAAARLPNGEGTRAEICELLKDSQFLAPDVTSAQVSTTLLFDGFVLVLADGWMMKSKAITEIV